MAPPQPTSGLLRLDRDAETSPRRLMILAGVGGLLVLGALWSFGDEDEAPPPAVTASPSPSDDEARRALASRAITPAPARVEQAAPAASAAGLELHGVMGFGQNGAAIIAADGQQRLVRVGRDVLPGLPLESVAADHVILLERGTPVRLAFPDAPLSQAGSGPPAARRAPGEAALRERIQRESLEYRLGFAPRRVNGRIDGFVIRPGASMPLFERAGLRPGDVVLRVAGDPWRSTENISELADQIAYRDTIEIEFERAGQRRTVTTNRE